MADIHIAISGQQRETEFVKTKINEEINNLIRKLGKLVKIDDLSINIKRFDERAGRVKYSVKAKLITEHGMFFSESHAWNITKAVGEALDKLDKMVVKKKEKEKTL